MGRQEDRAFPADQGLMVPWEARGRLVNRVYQDCRGWTDPQAPQVARGLKGTREVLVFREIPSPAPQVALVYREEMVLQELRARGAPKVLLAGLVLPPTLDLDLLDPLVLKVSRAP